MFNRQQLRRLPPDIQLEVETLLSDLRGERPLPSEARDASGLSRHERDAELTGLFRLRRFMGGSRTDKSR
jgi:hypothetical protein